MPMIATKVETHKWVSYADLTAFILSKDGKQLPGMVTVDSANPDKSIENEITRLQTDYGTYDAATKKVSFGPWFTPIDRDEIASAVKGAINQP